MPMNFHRLFVNPTIVPIIQYHRHRPARSLWLAATAPGNASGTR